MAQRTCLVYSVVALGVQALMSWDGGATQNCANVFAKDGWSAAEIGLLVGIDRFPGVVMTAPLWGYVMSKFAAKKFLLLAIFAKAVSSLMFGVLDPSWKLAMIASRMSMGIWEALFAVWVLGWVGHHAADDQKVSWLNSLGIAAGTGSGVGGFVTGLLGMYFAWSYRVQAGILFGILAIVVFLPSEEVEVRRAAASCEQPGDRASLQTVRSSYLNSKLYEVNVVDASFAPEAIQQGTGFARPSYLQQLIELTCGSRHSTVWLHTCFAFSLCAYVQTGFSCLWQNLAMYVWGFQQAQATTTLLLVMFVAGFSGITYGEMWIGERRSQGETLEAKRRLCLQALKSWALRAACCGSLSALVVAVKVQNLVLHNRPQTEWGIILVCLLSSIAALNFAVNGMQGFFCSENREAAPRHLRSTADGLQVTIQNLIGFGMGAFLPGAVTSWFGHLVNSAWPGMDQEAVDGAQYAFGMCSVLLAPWLLYASTVGALRGLPADAAPGSWSTASRASTQLTELHISS